MKVTQNGVLPYSHNRDTLPIALKDSCILQNRVPVAVVHTHWAGRYKVVLHLYPKNWPSLVHLLVTLRR